MPIPPGAKRASSMTLELARTQLADAKKVKNFTVLRDLLDDFPPWDIGRLIGELPIEDTVLYFRVLPRDLAAKVFEYLPVRRQRRILRALGREETATLLIEMAPDDRTTLLEELPGNVTK